MNECLPDVPLAAQDTEIFVGYKSSFLNTLLQLRAIEGAITVKTDNLSVLAIMKESLSQSASSRKMKVNVEMTEIEYEAAICTIDSVFPLVS